MIKIARGNEKINSKGGNILIGTQISWRLEKFSNRESLRKEKVAELFYGSVGDNSKQNPSAMKNLCLCSNSQYFWL